MQTLHAKSGIKNNEVKAKKLSKKAPKKSLGELIMQNIPDGKYKGLLSLLEPHELPAEK